MDGRGLACVPCPQDPRPPLPAGPPRNSSLGEPRADTTYHWRVLWSPGQCPAVYQPASQEAGVAQVYKSPLVTASFYFPKLSKTLLRMFFHPRAFPASSPSSGHPPHLPSVIHTLPAIFIPSRHPSYPPSILCTFPESLIPSQHPPYLPRILHSFPASSVPSQNPSYPPRILHTFPESFIPSQHPPHLPSIIHTFPASSALHISSIRPTFRPFFLSSRHPLLLQASAACP